MITVVVSLLASGLATAAGAVLVLTAAAVILHAAVQTNHIAGQRIVYSLSAEARSRLNAVYMTCIFLCGAVGSALGSLTYFNGGWWLTVSAGAVIGEFRFVDLPHRIPARPLTHVSVGSKLRQRVHRCSSAIKLDVSQRLPPIACTCAVELIDQRGERQVGAVPPRLGKADIEILAHPVDGEAEIEFAGGHGLVAVLHLPGLRRALGNGGDQLFDVEAGLHARSAAPRRGPAQGRRCRSG